MAREKESYRDNLERIHERFPDKECLTITDVKNFTGLGFQHCKKRFGFAADRTISKAKLARELS